MARRTLSWRGHAAIFAAIAGIYAVDLHTPLGLGVPFLYLLVILLAIVVRAGTGELLAMAGLCTFLAGSKLLIPSIGGAVAFGQGNRLIFAVITWTVVGLEYIRRRCEATIEAKRREVTEELEGLFRERTKALHRTNAELVKEVAERKQAERTVNDYANRLHGLANQLVEAEELERERLAAELHDRIGQNLSVLSMNLSLALSQVTDPLPPEATDRLRARIKDALALVEGTTELVRGVMEELHPVLLDQYGLGAALRWYGEEYSRRTGIEVAIEGAELFPRLRPKVEMTLFRIAQEALTNVAKHAGARRVAVSLRRNESGIELAITDNGAGFEPETVPDQAVGSGWGLTLMAERARSVGADFRIDSRPGQGTRIVMDMGIGLWEVDHGDHGTDR
ncbi:MAG TPA: sensor histidine kinase [Rhodocyclaceae bacterium]|nr:sensor histidine kinase [Rhodocyclaceae bacterium]